MGRCHVSFANMRVFWLKRVNLKGFKYLFSFIFDEKIRLSKYLGGICWVVKKYVSTNSVECLFIKSYYEFYLTMNVCKFLSKICINVLTVESLPIVWIDSLVSLRGIRWYIEEWVMFSTKNVSTSVWSKRWGHVQHLVNFMKDMWSRNVLTSVNELHAIESKKGAETHNWTCLRFQERLPTVIESRSER